jgi:hypothetical protein
MDGLEPAINDLHKVGKSSMEPKIPLREKIRQIKGSWAGSSQRSKVTRRVATDHQPPGSRRMTCRLQLLLRCGRGNRLSGNQFMAMREAAIAAEDRGHAQAKG